MNNTPGSDFSHSAPYWLRRIGVQSWLFIGVVLAFAVFTGLFAVLNDILIPLIISFTERPSWGNGGSRPIIASADWRKNASSGGF